MEDLFCLSGVNISQSFSTPVPSVLHEDVLEGEREGREKRMLQGWALEDTSKGSRLGLEMQCPSRMSSLGKASSPLNVIEETPEFKVLGAPARSSSAFLGTSGFTKPPPETNYSPVARRKGRYAWAPGVRVGLQRAFRHVAVT